MGTISWNQFKAIDLRVGIGMFDYGFFHSNQEIILAVPDEQIPNGKKLC